jgi:hypothetical protein
VADADAEVVVELAVALVVKREDVEELAATIVTPEGSGRPSW